MRREIFLILIFLSFLPTKVFSSELKNQYFCRILGEEVSKNVFNRNKQYIPNWIKPFINEELLVQEIVYNTLLDEVVVENNKILTNAVITGGMIHARGASLTLASYCEDSGVQKNAR